MRISQIWMQFRVLHATLLASLLIYGVMVAFVTRGPATTPITMDPGLVLPLLGGVAAAVLVVLVPLLRRRLMPAREGFPGHEPDLDAVADGAVLAALNKLRTALIVSWSLCESVGVMGLVAGFLFLEPLYFVPFGVAALGAMLAYAPRRSLLDEVVRAARRT